MRFNRQYARHLMSALMCSLYQHIKQGFLYVHNLNGPGAFKSKRSL